MKKTTSLTQKINRLPLVVKIKQLPVWTQTLLMVTVTSLVFLYRGNPFFFNPQLFAEDGALWLAQGYNRSIWAMFDPVNGFLHIPERLFGFFLARLPLLWAPFLYALAAWAFFIFTAYYLLSRRTNIVSNTYQRIMLVICLCLISNIDILFFNFSNAAFLMGIIGLLIMIATPARYKTVRILEKAFFFISCFNLTFAWFYLPVALWERFKNKQKNNFFLLSSALASIVQLCFFLSTHVNRSPVTLVSLWSKYILLEIYNQMIIPGLRFARIDTDPNLYGIRVYAVYVVFFTVIGLLVAGYFGLRKSNKQVWYLLFFLAAMTFASLKSPTITAPSPVSAFKTMSIVTDAGRYFVYGILAVNIIFIKASYAIITPKARYAFMIGFAALGLTTSVAYHNFFVTKGNYTDYSAQYQQRIKQFNTGRIEYVLVPQNPISWTMRLDRKN